jgi:hypothetical protein
MGTTQGNSLCSYLYLKLAKTSCFSFYLSCFFFYKVGEQEDGTGSGVGGCHQWEGEVAEKRVGDEYRANNVHTYM